MSTEILNEAEYIAKYPLAYSITENLFSSDTQWNKEDFEWAQGYVVHGLIEIYYAHKENENLTFMWEAWVGNESEGRGEFALD